MTPERWAAMSHDQKEVALAISESNMRKKLEHQRQTLRSMANSGSSEPEQKPAPMPVQPHHVPNPHTAALVDQARRDAPIEEEVF
jgi:hypothetical protein